MQGFRWCFLYLIIAQILEFVDMGCVVHFFFFFFLNQQEIERKFFFLRIFLLATGLER
jgi:hypothetical protein